MISSQNFTLPEDDTGCRNVGEIPDITATIKILVRYSLQN